MNISRCFALLAVCAIAVACGGKPFDVRVQPRVEPETISAPGVSGPLSVRASAVWDEAWLLENFDANLILAHVLAVRAEIANTGTEPIAAKKLDLSASDAEGRVFKVLDAKRARKAIEGYYSIAVSSKTGEAQYKEDFAANALDLKTPLAPGERRQGFLFFAIPPEVGGQVPVRLVVASKRAGARVEIALD